METRLLSIYDRVSDWLKFAEAKNAGLVAFNVAVVAGILGAWERFSFLGCAQPYVLFSVILALVVAACIALAAMIPMLAFLEGKISIDETVSSTVFYGHIAHRFPSPEAYLDELAKNWDEKGHDPRKPGEIDLANQIIQLSRIAHHKYVHFKWAGWITLFVVGLIVGAVVIWLIHRAKVAKKPTVHVATESANANAENQLP